MESIKSIGEVVCDASYDSATIYPLLSPNMLVNAYNFYKKNGEDSLADHQAETINNYILQSDALCWLPDKELSILPSIGPPTCGEHESPKEVWSVYPGRSDLEVSNTCLDPFPNPTSDAKNCYTHMTTTDDFCQKIFDRRPVQYKKNPEWNECLMRSVVVPKESNLSRFKLQKYNLYNSAHYITGVRTAFFGAPDPRMYTSFIHQDIIAHEFGHAITDSYGGLVYLDQSGALNESMSDIFATIIKHYPGVQANDPDTDWLLGEGFIAREDTNYGTALRSMRSPGGAYRNHEILGSDIQVGHMSRYIDTTEDRGGVHMNSGIPNRAFYLASYGMGGSCWEKTGRVWHSTLQDVSCNVTFSEFAALTIRKANQLYGGSAENIVGKAWSDVGVDLRKSPSHKPKPPQSGGASWKTWVGGAALVIGGVLAVKAASGKGGKGGKKED